MGADRFASPRARRCPVFSSFPRRFPRAVSFWWIYPSGSAAPLQPAQGTLGPVMAPVSDDEGRHGGHAGPWGPVRSVTGCPGPGFPPPITPGPPSLTGATAQRGAFSGDRNADREAALSCLQRPERGGLVLGSPPSSRCTPSFPPRCQPSGV